MAITIEKCECSQYNIRCTDSGNHWWAIIMVSKNGLVNIQSDYGNYCYRWNSIGERSIEEFLINCDINYLSGKFGGLKEREFDFVGSLKEIRQYIIEKRKMNDISSKEAKFYWTRCSDIKALDSEQYMEAVCESCWDTSLLDTSLLALYNDDISAVPHITKRSYSLTSFMEKIWPVFIEKLRESIISNNIPCKHKNTVDTVMCLDCGKELSRNLKTN